MSKNESACIAPRRPALRYHGGKWRLAKWIIANMPEHRIYVEPFCGAASVLLQKPRVFGEIINDLDGEVVNFFQVLRDPVSSDRLRHLLIHTPYARAEFESASLQSDDPIEQARRTVVKSFMGFSSGAICKANDGMRTRASTWIAPTGFRGDAKRRGTTPATDWAGYPNNIDTLSNRLRGVVIENRPAINIIQCHDDAETLFYVDPPYVHGTRKLSAGYRHEMTDLEHEELSHALHSVKGMVMISGYTSELYNRLYADWNCIVRDHLADHARNTVECLWFSPNIKTIQNGLGL